MNFLSVFPYICVHIPSVNYLMKFFNDHLKYTSKKNKDMCIECFIKMLSLVPNFTYCGIRKILYAFLESMQGIVYTFFNG